jgi:hypothetical protein
MRYHPCQSSVRALASGGLQSTLWLWSFPRARPVKGVDRELFVFVQLKDLVDLRNPEHESDIRVRAHNFHVPTSFFDLLLKPNEDAKDGALKVYDPFQVQDDLS